MANVTINLNQTGNPTISDNSNISTILQTALNTIHTDGILTINFPSTKSTYYINSTIDVYSDTIIDFNGSVIKRSIVNENDMFNVGYRYSSIGVNSTVGYTGGGKNVTFKNANFEGNSTKAYNTTIGCHHVSNIKLLNCNYTDALNGESALKLFGCDDILVDNCVFTGFEPNGNKGYIQCIRLDSSTKESTSNTVYSDSTYDGLPTKNIVVQNCKFLPLYNSTKTILKHAPTPIGNHRFVKGMYFSGIKFLNNIVQDSSAYGNITNETINTSAWLRLYSVKANPTEENINFDKIGAIIQGNTFTSTLIEDLTLVNGIAKKPVNNSAIHFQSKSDVVDIKDIKLASNSAKQGIPQPSSDIQIINNRFVGFNSELINRPVVKIEGQTSNSEVVPYYNDLYAKDVLIIGNTFENCFNNIKAKENLANGISPANAISPDTISLSYVDNAMVTGNDYIDCRRGLYATDCKNIYMIGCFFTSVKYMPVSFNLVDSYEIKNLIIDSTCDGGIYTTNCSNGIIDRNNINEIGMVSSSFPAYIAVKESSNIKLSYNKLTNSTLASKKHKYGIYAYTNVTNISETSNTFSGFTTNVSIN